MATKKTFDERIEYIKEKQEKLKAQEKELRKNVLLYIRKELCQNCTSNPKFARNSTKIQ